jgi:exonuclease III
MQKNGFIDSFRENNKDPSVKVGATWGGFDDDDFLADRIDYIYYKGENIKSIKSKVISEDPPGGFFNSDHRSVISVFEVK